MLEKQPSQMPVRQTEPLRQIRRGPRIQCTFVDQSQGALHGGRGSRPSRRVR